MTFGFDKMRGEVHSFLVLLLHSPTTQTRSWGEVARIDHNPAATDGHDLYAEGMHVDITVATGGEKKFYLQDAVLPRDRGVLLDQCLRYLNEHAEFFLRVFRTGEVPDSSDGPLPSWIDDGE